MTKKRSAILYTIVISILFASKIFAQSATIKGQVILSSSQQGAPFASIRLFNNKVFVKGVVADTLGVFSFDRLEAKDYNLEISLLGYKSKNVSITVKPGLNELRKIQLDDSAELLKEVKITSTKPFITRKTDRYILNVGETSLTAGRNVTELLNYAPGVIVNGTDISINGRSGTKVMVNGRLLRMSLEQMESYLASLRSENIASIEIIPNPGAEFDAEGAGGILNIVLKKSHSAGLTTIIGGEIASPMWPSYSGNLQLNYNYKKLQLFGSYNAEEKNRNTYFGDHRNSLGNQYTTENVNDIRNTSQNFRIGGSYDINAKHSIAAEFNGNVNNANVQTSSISTLYSNDILTNNIRGVFLNVTQNKLYNSSLNYSWKLDSLGSELNVLADLTRSLSNGSGDFNSRYTDAAGNFVRDSLYRNYIPVDVRNFSLASNFSKKYKNTDHLKFGLKFTRTTTQNNVRYDYMTGGNYVYDTSRSNEFGYTENISAAYAEYLKNWENFSVQVGLRSEWTKSIGISSTNAVSFDRNYINFFPSVLIKKKWDTDQTLTFNYTRRFNRPSFNILNPFEWRVNDYTYIQGNPNLLPQYSNSLQLTYSLNNKYDFTLISSFSTDVFSTVLLPAGPENLVARYFWQNVSKQTIYGLNIYLPYTITKWWNTTNNLLGFYKMLDFVTEKNMKFIAQVKSNHVFKISDSWQADLSGTYLSPFIASNLTYVANYSIDFGLRKSFFNKKLNARFLITDIFNTSVLDYTSSTGNLNIDAYQKYLTRRVSLNLSYNLNLGKTFKNRQINSGNSDEKDRMK
ncbi:TonB-dependent receptor domain-containing protein [Pedobacter sp. AW1-32]|uniref:TonB-dependent receptor domain-containing protein n=1 Tax=Pedobacter sp. AW1-32 TaxID=3383026 RepID=UPI003FEFC792